MPVAPWVAARDEIAELLNKLWKCEREHCGITRDIDFRDEDAAEDEDGTKAEEDAARELRRIMDEARESAPEQASEGDE